MDQPQPSGSSQPNDNIPKANNEEDQGVQSENRDAVAVTVDQTADILKLDIDCCEEALDYLPFEDLVNVGKTCKRLQQVSGYCFQQNYQGAAWFGSEGIKIYGCDLKHFAPFIQKVYIHVKDFQCFVDVRPKLRRLKYIQIQGNQIDLNCLNKISMDKLTVLSLHFCDFGNNFHEIMDACPSLKYLSLFYCKLKLNWFDRKYPTLEYFQFFPRGSEEKIISFQEIPKFLELNPNIRKFATTDEWLEESIDNILRANIKLNDLVIQYHSKLDDSKFDSMINLLNKLHEHGFYRKLHVSQMNEMNQMKINQLATLNGLVKLHAVSPPELITFSALKNLECLHLNYPRIINDLEMLLKNLTNLKRIGFEYSTIDDIMPFIRHSVEMQKICIRRVVVFNQDTEIVIDLLALNREREKLPDAQKITLYVEEEIYLATKWAMKGSDFALIRLKRIESIKLDEDDFTWLVDFIL